MNSNQRKEQLKHFLLRFDSAPVRLLASPSAHPNPMEEFVIAYMGMCFVQGYRILDKIDDNIFALSRMEYQLSSNKGHASANAGLYRFVGVYYNEKVFEDREQRAKKFKEWKELVDNFSWDAKDDSRSHIEIHILFAFSFTFSILSADTISKCSSLSTKNFYSRDYGIGKKQTSDGRKQNERYGAGLRLLNQRDQGTKLHQLIELSTKGSGLTRNPCYLYRRVFHHSKFSYNVEKVLNTFCFIVGKEMIEGGYQTISSEKWMRKYSEKKFKKFDLLLRNEHKVCIIDWKFSKVKAHEKIASLAFLEKNRRYFQLARKQYNAQVELKFYCFHQEEVGHFHKFTTALYEYTIENVDVEDVQVMGSQIEIESDSDDEIAEIKRAPRPRTPHISQDYVFVDDDLEPDSSNPHAQQNQPQLIHLIQNDSGEQASVVSVQSMPHEPAAIESNCIEIVQHEAYIEGNAMIQSSGHPQSPQERNKRLGCIQENLQEFERDLETMQKQSRNELEQMWQQLIKEHEKASQPSQQLQANFIQTEQEQEARLRIPEQEELAQEISEQSPHHNIISIEIDKEEKQNNVSSQYINGNLQPDCILIDSEEEESCASSEARSKRSRPNSRKSRKSKKSRKGRKKKEKANKNIKETTTWRNKQVQIVSCSSDEQMEQATTKKAPVRCASLQIETLLSFPQRGYEAPASENKRIQFQREIHIIDRTKIIQRRSHQSIHQLKNRTIIGSNHDENAS